MKLLLSFVTLPLLLCFLIKTRSLKYYLPVFITSGMLELFTLILVMTTVIGVLQQVAFQPVGYFDLELISSDALLLFWYRVIPSLVGIFVCFYLYQVDRAPINK